MWAYSVGFWAAVFASLLGVWQSVPYLYADFYGVLKGLPVDGAQRGHQGDEHAVPAGAALHHAGAAAVRLHRRAAARSSSPTRSSAACSCRSSPRTLLYLNNRVPWPTRRAAEPLATNVLLVAILVLFLFVGAQEAMGAMRRIMG